MPVLIWTVLWLNKGEQHETEKTFSIIKFSICLIIYALWPASQPVTARAAVSALGDVTGTQVSGTTLVLTVDSGSSPSDKLTLEVCDEDILRVNYQPDGVSSSEQTPMIDPDLKWDASAAVINTASDPITIKTDEMQVEINKKPCRMTVKKSRRHDPVLGTSKRRRFPRWRPFCPSGFLQPIRNPQL
uniref:DUF4968 domain-containing protein n=1 Tax=Clostridium sp. NkU-1 TaxID=1095009 RepID=UPI000A4EB943